MKKETIICHDRQDFIMENEPVAFPIFQTSTYKFSTVQQLVNYLIGEKGYYLYSRYENPTIELIEGKLAALEKAEDAVVFSSGMAAITLSILSFINNKDEILCCSDIYGMSYEFFKNWLPRFGARVNFFSSREVHLLSEKVSENIKVIYFETPTNPLNNVIDISVVSQIAEKYGIKVIVDNTFATPIFQNPIEHGASLVIHSGTKYLSGHSDLLCGVVCGSKEDIKKIKETRKVFGSCLSAIDAFLLNRGLKTLSIRVNKQAENAMKIAMFLREHPNIEKVYYPGLQDDENHQLAKKQMKGFGAMIAFDVKDGFEAAKKLIDNLKIIVHASSLGGTETLISMPILTSHARCSEEELKLAGVSDKTVRLSVGIEDADDLIEDLKKSL